MVKLSCVNSTHYKIATYILKWMEYLSKSYYFYTIEKWQVKLNSRLGRV